MKKTCILLCLLILMSSLGAAQAADSLSGRIEGRTLYVTWNVGCSGECTLTVSQNNWPICVRNVNAGDCGMTLSLSEVSGNYTLRLKKADGGCLTAKVTGGKTTPEPTKAPTPEPTVVCTTEPTKVDDLKPVDTPQETPVVEITPEPTTVATAVPTEMPVETLAPTIVPDPEETPAPTIVSDPEETLAPTIVPVPEETPIPTIVPTRVPIRTSTPEPIRTVRPAPTSGAVTWRDDLAAQVMELVNEERAKLGLQPLRWNEALARAARVRGGEIAQVFSHTRPDGTSWSTVSSSAYGENIAMGQRDAERVMASWMTSTGHRENILRASYGSIGVCACTINGVMYWVQLFGK